MFSVLTVLITIATAIKKIKQRQNLQVAIEKNNLIVHQKIFCILGAPILFLPALCTINPNEFQPLKMYFRFMTAIRNFRELK